MLYISLTYSETIEMMQDFPATVSLYLLYVAIK